MADIDFITFGVKQNDMLFARIEHALQEVYKFGDLELRAAWLYYASIPKAAQALRIPVCLYREALQRKPYLRGTSVAFESISDDMWSLFSDGASLLMAMSDRERWALFPTNRRLRLVGEAFVRKVELWRTEHVYDANLGHLCVGLLERYKRMWRYRQHPRVVFESAVSDPLKALLPSKRLLEDKAGDREIYSVALEIIGEYETYRWHRERVTQHIKNQRKILDRKRKFFREALELRDGKKCANPKCRSTKRLRIDHKHPVSLGGRTEIENLQLLCFLCNSKKSNKTELLRQ
jgi:HNH endonuclease